MNLNPFARSSSLSSIREALNKQIQRTKANIEAQQKREIQAVKENIQNQIPPELALLQKRPRDSEFENTNGGVSFNLRNADPNMKQTTRAARSQFPINIMEISPFVNTFMKTQVSKWNTDGAKDYVANLASQIDQINKTPSDYKITNIEEYLSKHSRKYKLFSDDELMAALGLDAENSISVKAALLEYLKKFKGWQENELPKFIRSTKGRVYLAWVKDKFLVPLNWNDFLVQTSPPGPIAKILRKAFNFFRNEPLIAKYQKSAKSGEGIRDLKFSNVMKRVAKKYKKNGDELSSVFNKRSLQRRKVPVRFDKLNSVITAEVPASEPRTPFQEVVAAERRLSRAQRQVNNDIEGNRIAMRQNLLEEPTDKIINKKLL